LIDSGIRGGHLAARSVSRVVAASIASILAERAAMKSGQYQD
jgi:hypothetical protein